MLSALVASGTVLQPILVGASYPSGVQILCSTPKKLRPKHCVGFCMDCHIYIRGAPIEDFTDIPITDILSRIKADTDNR